MFISPKAYAAACDAKNRVLRRNEERQEQATLAAAVAQTVDERRVAADECAAAKNEATFLARTWTDEHVRWTAANLTDVLAVGVDDADDFIDGFFPIS